MRRELGVEAFGINWFEIPPNAEGLEHDETETQQEEVNVIVAGSGSTGSKARMCPSASAAFFASIPGRRGSRLPGRTG